MIARLKGVIDQLLEDQAVIDVNGVGYLVACSGRTLSRLSVGEAATLLVETVVREDAILLYGFLDQGEQAWFTKLTTLQGVGNKAALAILSVLSPHDLSQAIAAGDKAAITRANGVGPKLAARVISELKDKVAGLPTTQAPAGVPAPATQAAGGDDVTEDAVSALVNLGYARMEAYGAVSRAARALGEGAKAQQLITAALKTFAREGG